MLKAPLIELSLLLFMNQIASFLGMKRSTGHHMFRKVPQSKLGISEPNPVWFGNKPNEPTNPAWNHRNWLKSRFHFAFAEYSNARNNGFGVLRVMNDDLVQPNRGFGAHPHKDVEICTYIVHGKLTHQDSMGTSETLGKGAIQFMTAGSGVRHSEHNMNKRNPLRFVQMWIDTREKGVAPNYGSYPNPSSPSHKEQEKGNRAARQNAWSHLVSDVLDHTTDTPIKINQDANIFVTEITPGNTVEFCVKNGRQAYLLCLEGSASISDTGTRASEQLDQHDGAEIYGPNVFTATPVGDEKLHMLLVEMEYTGFGRTDL